VIKIPLLFRQYTFEELKSSSFVAIVRHVEHEVGVVVLGATEGRHKPCERSSENHIIIRERKTASKHTCKLLMKHIKVFCIPCLPLWVH